MAFFGNKNEKAKARILADEPTSAPETAQTLNQLHQTRQMLNNIYDSMCDIDFATIERKAALQQATVISFVKCEDEETGETSFVEVERSGVEVLNDIRSTVALLKRKLEAEDAACLLEQETAVIDSKLWKFAQTLHQALDNINVDLDTARACVTGLIYGIMEGHRIIPESFDADERENELSVRERKIEDFEKIIKISKEIMKLRTTRDKIRDQNNNTVLPNFQRARQEYDKDRNERRSIYDEIKGVPGTDVHKMTKDHIEAWSKSANLVNLHRLHDQLKIQLATVDDTIKRFDVSIETIKNAAAVENIFFNEKLHREIDETISRIPDKLLVVIETTNAAQQSLDNMSSKFDAALNSHDMAIATTQTMNALEELEQNNARELEREKDDAAARMAELMVEAEREQIEADIEAQRLAEKYEAEKAKAEEEIKAEIAAKPVVTKPPVMKAPHKVKKTK